MVVVFDAFNTIDRVPRGGVASIWYWALDSIRSPLVHVCSLLDLSLTISHFNDWSMR